MKLHVIVLIALLLLLTSAVGSAHAQESGRRSFEGPALPFTLVILGTRHYADVEALLRSLRELPPMAILVPTLESQHRLEYAGRFHGPEPSLLADIASLAINRFEIASQRSDRTLQVTLRKIAASSIPAKPPAVEHSD